MEEKVLKRVSNPQLMEPHDLTVLIDAPDPTKIERITPEILAAVKTKIPTKLERKFAKK